MTSSAGRICAKSSALSGGFSGSRAGCLGIESLLSRIRFPQADDARHGVAIGDNGHVEASRNRTYLHCSLFTMTGTDECEGHRHVYRGVFSKADPVLLAVRSVFGRIELDEHNR